MATVSNLTEAVEQFRGASSKARQATFRELVARIRQAIREDGTAEAATAFRRTIAPSLDYTSFQTLYRLYQSLAGRAARRKRKSPFCGGTTTAKLAMAVKLALFSMGGAVETFETDYGVYRQEFLDPNSALYEWRPNTIFLATGWRDWSIGPSCRADTAEVRGWSGPSMASGRACGGRRTSGPGCQIIQNNFDRPGLAAVEQPRIAAAGRLGALYQSRESGPGRPGPALCGDPRSGRFVGLRRAAIVWGDERLYHHAKMPCPPQRLVDYGFSVASLAGGADGT